MYAYAATDVKKCERDRLIARKRVIARGFISRMYITRMDIREGKKEGVLGL